jgi:hypothetical protein
LFLYPSSLLLRLMKRELFGWRAEFGGILIG